MENIADSNNSTVFTIYTREELVDKIVEAGEFLMFKSSQDLTLADLIDKYSTFKKDLSKFLEGKKADRSMFVAVDIYCSYLEKKYKSQLPHYEAILDMYSYIYGVDLKDESKIDLDQMVDLSMLLSFDNQKCSISEILNKKIDLSVVPMTEEFINGFATYMFNKNNKDSLLSVKEYLELEKQVLKNGKNR